MASLSARLSSESPPHSESPARLRPAFATILLLTPHTGLPLYRYLGPPQTWSRTHAQARPGSTPPRGTHPSHGAPSPATSSRPSHGLSLTSLAPPRPWSYQTWSRTRAPARPGSIFFVAHPFPRGSDSGHRLTSLPRTVPQLDVPSWRSSSSHGLPNTSSHQPWAPRPNFQS